jgi:hypothetical protein
MVPATVSTSQMTDMKKTNISLSRPTPDNDNPTSKLTSATSTLPIGTASQTPVTMIMIGVGLIATASMVRKKLERNIPLNRPATEKNYKSDYDRPVFSRG